MTSLLTLCELRVPASYVARMMARLVRERTNCLAGLKESCGHFSTSPVRTRSLKRELQLRAKGTGPGTWTVTELECVRTRRASGPGRR